MARLCSSVAVFPVRGAGNILSSSVCARTTPSDSMGSARRGGAGVWAADVLVPPRSCGDEVALPGL